MKLITNPLGISTAIDFDLARLHNRINETNRYYE